MPWSSNSVFLLSSFCLRVEQSHSVALAIYWLPFGGVSECIVVHARCKVSRGEGPYTAPLWVVYKQASFRKLKVAYNVCLRILLKEPRWTSASELFCQTRIRSFGALLRNLMFKFIGCLNISNAIIKLMAEPSCSTVRYSSHCWQHRYTSLMR